MVHSHYKLTTVNLGDGQYKLASSITTAAS